MINRGENGRFLPGPMPEDIKQKIREGQIRRYQRAQTQVVAEPELKRCTGCKQWKDRKKAFVQRTRKLKSGRVAVYPSAQCRECEAKRMEAWREKLRQDPKLAVETHRRWKNKQPREKRNRERRERDRMNRRLDGVYAERGPWKRYRHELEDKTFQGWLDAEAVYDYFERFMSELYNSDGGNAYLHLNGMSVLPEDADYLRRLRAGRAKQVTLAKVDELCIRYDLPLWEVEEAARLVG